MRYHYIKPEVYTTKYAKTYTCDHPLYKQCTLYLLGGKGLAVIQQRFNQTHRLFWWGPIDPWLVDDIYMQYHFLEVFNRLSAEPENNIYPTITVRKLMWELRMKPMKKQPWEFAP